MIIYIHGFGSSGEGIKAILFREYFKSKDQGFIAPSLSYVPELAIKTLEELIESYNGKASLIGSSLGGFYSVYLAKKYDLKAVLINPSIFPYETLQKVLGITPNFYDNSCFEYKETHLKMLRQYMTDTNNDKNFMLLLQRGDESLDYTHALKKFPNSYQIVEDGVSHSFENIERHFEKIYDFLTSKYKISS